MHGDLNTISCSPGIRGVCEGIVLTVHIPHARTKLKKYTSGRDEGVHRTASQQTEHAQIAVCYLGGAIIYITEF